MKPPSLLTFQLIYWGKKKKKSKEIPWNFAKFLISADGQIIKYYNPRVDPIGVMKDIERYLSNGSLWINENANTNWILLSKT